MRTQEELTYIVNNVAELLYQRIERQITIKAKKFIKELWQQEYNKLHPEKLINREEFLKQDINKYYNFKTKKQITSIKTILRLKENKYKGKYSRYYATKTQFYSIKRKIKQEEENNGVVAIVSNGVNFINLKIYNYYQTEEIKDEDWEEPETRYLANKRIKQLRESLLYKYNFYCNNCKKQFLSTDLEIDHIVPISLGGKTIANNLQVLCKTCNKKKYTN
jgi:hypothetical protein